MSRHTSGPWGISPNGVRYSINSESKHVAMVSCYVHKRGEDEENKANANLIAAAPDLLDALEYALPYLRACVPNPRNGYNADGTLDVNCIDRAEAAIRKAKGES